MKQRIQIDLERFVVRSGDSVTMDEKLLIKYLEKSITGSSVVTRRANYIKRVQDYIAEQQVHAFEDKQVENMLGL